MSVSIIINKKAGNQKSSKFNLDLNSLLTNPNGLFENINNRLSSDEDIKELVIDGKSYFSFDDINVRSLNGKTVQAYIEPKRGFNIVHDGTITNNHGRVYHLDNSKHDSVQNLNRDFQNKLPHGAPSNGSRFVDSKGNNFNSDSTKSVNYHSRDNNFRTASKVTGG